MAFYTKQVEPTEAICFDDSDAGVGEVQRFCGEYAALRKTTNGKRVFSIYSFKTKDHHDFQACFPGNYIIKMTEGFCVMIAKDFHKKYSPLYHVNNSLF